METMRPEAIAHIRDGFAFLEMTLLADGREWILKTDKPSLADIEGTPHLHLLSLPPADTVVVVVAKPFGHSIGSMDSETHFPRI